jgi:hypothetical protein
MMNRLTSHAVSLALPLLAATTLSAATAGPFGFESGTAASNQYTNNFLQLYSRDSGTFSQTDPADAGEPNNDFLKLARNGNANNTAITAINTAAVKTLSSSDSFAGTVTLTFDLASDAPGGSGFALYLFDPTSTNGSDSLVVTLQFNQNAETDRVRFYSDGTPTTGSTGTQHKGTLAGTGGTFAGGDGTADTYYQANWMSQSNEAAATWTAASLVYTPGANDDTTLQFAVGQVSATWTVPNALRVSNPAIAFRANTYGSGAQSWRVDNIYVVPEPGLLGLLPIAGLLARRGR